MKTQSQKNKLILFLLIHGVIINLFLLPILFIYSSKNNANYISLSEWMKSICINLLTWQVVDHLSKQDGGSAIHINIRSELKKYASLVWLNHQLKTFFASEMLRKIVLNFLAWTVIVVNLFFPIVAVIFFDVEIDITFCCLWFVSFQFVFFIFHFLNYQNNHQPVSSDMQFESPWFLDSVFSNFIGKQN